MTGVGPPPRRIRWSAAWRIVPSRFPPVGVFDRIADPADLEALYAIEALTDARVRDELGTLASVPKERRISGPGSTPVMAAFTHRNPDGSRFSDGTYGVFYAANDLDTAIAETTYHRARFMRATAQARMELDMRVYLVDLSGDLHDLRKRRPEFERVYHNDNYAAGQHLARALRRQASNGIAYDSGRHAGGESAAIFRPRLLSNARQERHLCYIWDGHTISALYEKRKLDSPASPS